MKEKSPNDTLAKTYSVHVGPDGTVAKRYWHIFERDGNLYVSDTYVTDSGARGIFRRATLSDHMLATELLVDQCDMLDQGAIEN